MFSSSDIANLMEQAQKLKATFNKFAVKLADEGMIDRNKLPWISSIANDSARVIVSDLPSSNLCTIEVKETLVECMLPKSDTTLSAHQLFDKMTRPNNNFNHLVVTQSLSSGNKYAEIELIETIASQNIHMYASGEEFATVPNPPYDVWQHSDNDGTLSCDNNVFQYQNGKCPDSPEQKNYWVAEVYGDFEGKTRRNCIEEVPLLTAQKMLDKMPLPNFINEMAAAIKMEEDNSIECENMPILDVVYDDQDDTLLYDRRMFARLGALDGSYFIDLVTIGTSKAHFSSLPSLLFDGCQSSSQILYDDELFDGKLDYEYPRSQVRMVQVKVFDPGLILFYLPYGDRVRAGTRSSLFLTDILEDKDDFKGWEDKVYVKYTCDLFNVVVLCQSLSSLWLQTCVLAIRKTTCTMKCDDNHLTARYDTLMSMALGSFIFDPGGDWHLLVHQNGIADGHKLLCLYVETLCFTVGNVSEVQMSTTGSLKRFQKNTDLMVAWVFEPGGNYVFLSGEKWHTINRVQYKAAKVRTLLNWIVRLLMEYGSQLYNDAILVFDLGGLKFEPSRD